MLYTAMLWSMPTWGAAAKEYQRVNAIDMGRLVSVFVREGETEVPLTESEREQASKRAKKRKRASERETSKSDPTRCIHRIEHLPREHGKLFIKDLDLVSLFMQHLVRAGDQRQ